MNKETALQLVKELVDKFEEFADDMECNIFTSSENRFKNAKQCALIAVDEMIIQNGELYLLGLAKDYYIEKNAYLFDVKSELQSL
mgnify:CR=1 FL=1